MRIKVGEAIPAGVLKELKAGVPTVVTTADLFAGGPVVLFSCPGAFTPKSTEQQLPSYLKHAADMVSLGVKSIVCISVNDAFVMQAWGDACGVGTEIRMLADGHAEFHTSMGLEMDCTRFTLGFRSQRFSMLVENGMLSLLNVEEPGEYSVSDASVIYRQLTERQPKAVLS
nr:uncharacterized protein LOC133591457 [Nerophis lumbriciformis]